MKQATVSTVTHPRYTHRVRYTGPGGKAVYGWFKNETEAMAFAKKRNEETGLEGTAFGTLGIDEKAAVEFWRAFVQRSTDAPPPPLTEVLRKFTEEWKASRTSATVATAFESFIATKKGEGLRPFSIEGLETRCGRFADDFASRPVCTLTAGEITDWLLTLTDTRGKTAEGTKARAVSLLTKRNYRRDVGTFLAYCEHRGWITANPIRKTSKIKPAKARPGTNTPQEIQRFFDNLAETAPHLTPFWAVRFFAGIREQEALRMDWNMIDLAAKEIHLPDTITKTGHPRTIAMEPALVAFLKPCKARQGPITSTTTTARRYALAKLEKAAGLTLPKNSARHSFATYHLAAFRHAGETALQLGHGGSPEMLHRHYRGVTDEAEARAFWKIRPAKKTKARPATKASKSTNTETGGDQS
jgi:integrase